MKKIFSFSGACSALTERRHRPMFNFVAAALLALCEMAVSAQSTALADHAAHHLTKNSATTPAVAWTQGEVRKVDLAAGKVTLRHRRIENLDMPGMTMVFRAADAKLLNGLKEGDKVRFVAGLANGALTVSSIERAE
jgi:Cu/Ag efflux protein CusF